MYGEISSLNVVTAVASNFQNKRHNGQGAKKEKKKFSDILEEKADQEQQPKDEHGHIDLKS